MKIAFVTNEFVEPRSTQSSMPIWICNVASRLAKYHEVVVYSQRLHNQKEVEYFEGVKYRRISAPFDPWIGGLVQGVTKRISRFDKTQRKRPYFASAFNNFTYILKVARDLKAEKCDIVHIQEESEFVSVVRALNPKIRIVLHAHCEWLTQLDHSMIEPRLRKADLILGCSRYITDKTRQSFPSLARRCQTLYNGVDLVEFVSDPNKNEKKVEPKQLLFVSRVSPEKGLHVLIDAFKEVVEKNPCMRLDIVGGLDALPIEAMILFSEDSMVRELASFHRGGSSRPYLDYLKRRIVSLNISNNVTFHDRIPHEQKVKFYQAADLFIQPSITEPFGMGIIEAMACKVPVVATKVGGIPEIIENGKTGLLVEAGDCSALASAVLKLLSNDELRREIGENCRKRAEYFSWDNIVMNLLSLYEDMVNRVEHVIPQSHEY